MTFLLFHRRVEILCLISVIGIGIARAQQPARGQMALVTQAAGQQAGDQTKGSQPDSTAKPKIQVFIVGVPSWKVTDYQKDTVLGGDIADTCLEIKRFFKNRFGDEVQFHPAKDACTATATTRQAIRDQLEFELPDAAKGTLTFVFMMSHGQSVRGQNALFQWDTEFLTSDATDANKDRQSISLDSDLVPWLERSPNGSTVLVFVDSCNSGAVDNPAVQMEATEENVIAGVKLGLMVASTSHESTYHTAFTRSLLDLWKSGQCPNIKIEQYLQNQISTQIGEQLVGYDGRPEKVIRYAGGLCLSELGTQGHLLFLYQGATNNLIWKVASLDHPNVPDIMVDTDTDGFEFLILQPGNYKVEADDQQGKALYTDPDKIDFVNNSTLGVFFPDEQTTAEGAEHAMNAWVRAATTKGLPQAEVAKVQEATRRVSLYLGNFTTTNITNAQLAEELNEAKGDSTKLRSLGYGLLDDGQFEQASRVFVKAAKTAPNDQHTAWSAATEAFLAAGVAGDSKAVQTLNKTYPLNVGGGVRSVIVSDADAARNQKDGLAAERLKAISAMTLASLRAGILARSSPH